MAKVDFRYGGRKGKKRSLEVSDDLMVVRTHGVKSVFESELGRKNLRALQDFTSVFRIPDVGVEVMRCRAGKQTRRSVRDKARLALREETSVRFAGRALRTGAGTPVLYTENFFVQFKPGITAAKCKRTLKSHELTVKQQLEYASNAFFVAAKEGTGLETFAIARRLLDDDSVLLCHPEVIREAAYKRAFPAQWHLKRTSINGITIDAHANVEAAWEKTQGEGVTIAVIDDGVDLSHQELQGANKIVAPRDVTRGTNDPNPRSRDRHGTACAGVACANGIDGAAGVAPRSRLMPIRLTSFLGSQREADAFVWAAEHGADVISCSWGPPDGVWWDPSDPAHDEHVPLPDSTRLAIDFAVEQGRGGKGCVITWAAGNGNESVENDGYASYGPVVAVAACNDRGKRSAYSDKGESLWCAFPSSSGDGGRTPGIWTIDNVGASGYNAGNPTDGDAEGNYTNSFGGTSSAAPGAAGIAALVLARNPELRHDEVKDILKRCCDKIDGGYDANGHSPQYGYGRLNANRAVELAAPSLPSGTEYTAIHRTLRDVAIRDRGKSRIRVAVADKKKLKGVKVEVDLEHTWIGDLVVRLVPPPASGASPIVLHDRQGHHARNLHKVYDTASTPQLEGLTGVSPAGDWTLEVEDRANQDQGRIVSFGLELTF